MGRSAAPFLAKSAGYNGLGGCPDLRHFAVHSGGTVADFRGLSHFPCLLIVQRQSMSQTVRCQLGATGLKETRPGWMNYFDAEGLARFG